METVDLNLPRVPVSVSHARAGLFPLREALGERFQDVRLLVSELMTNAVQHGQGPTVRLIARVRGGSCHVEIVDGGSGFTPPSRDPGPTEANGRGLRIVGGLADDWGVYEGGSTHVWFVLDLDR